MPAEELSKREKGAKRIQDWILGICGTLTVVLLIGGLNNEARDRTQANDIRRIDEIQKDMVSSRRDLEARWERIDVRLDVISKQMSSLASQATVTAIQRDVNRIDTTLSKLDDRVRNMENHKQE